LSAFIPSLLEQKRIVEILDTAFAAIDKQKQTLKRIAECKRAFRKPSEFFLQ